MSYQRSANLLSRGGRFSLQHSPHLRRGKFLCNSPFTLKNSLCIVSQDSPTFVVTLTITCSHLLWDSKEEILQKSVSHLWFFQPLSYYALRDDFSLLSEIYGDFIQGDLRGSYSGGVELNFSQEIMRCVLHKNRGLISIGLCSIKIPPINF